MGNENRKKQTKMKEKYSGPEGQTQDTDQVDMDQDDLAIDKQNRNSQSKGKEECSGPKGQTIDTDQVDMDQDDLAIDKQNRNSQSKGKEEFSGPKGQNQDTDQVDIGQDDLVMDKKIRKSQSIRKEEYSGQKYQNQDRNEIPMEYDESLGGDTDRRQGKGTSVVYEAEYFAEESKTHGNMDVRRTQIQQQVQRRIEAPEKLFTICSEEDSAWKLAITKGFNLEAEDLCMNSEVKFSLLDLLRLQLRQEKVFGIALTNYIDVYVYRRKTPSIAATANVDQIGLKC